MRKVKLPKIYSGIQQYNMDMLDPYAAITLGTVVIKLDVYIDNEFTGQETFIRYKSTYKNPYFDTINEFITLDMIGSYTEYHSKKDNKVVVAECDYR